MISNRNHGGSNHTSRSRTWKKIWNLFFPRVQIDWMDKINNKWKKKLSLLLQHLAFSFRSALEVLLGQYYDHQMKQNHNQAVIWWWYKLEIYKTKKNWFRFLHIPIIFVSNNFDIVYIDAKQIEGFLNQIFIHWNINLKNKTNLLIDFIDFD